MQGLGSRVNSATRIDRPERVGRLCRAAARKKSVKAAKQYISLNGTLLRLAKCHDTQTRTSCLEKYLKYN